MSSELSHRIKAEALRLGFSACGIAKAEPVDEETARAFRNWLRQGGHATMQYMENYEDKRLDPRLLMPGVKSIISVALNYTPETPVKGFANCEAETASASTKNNPPPTPPRGRD